MHGDGLFLKDSFWRKQGLIPHHILPRISAHLLPHCSRSCLCRDTVPRLCGCWHQGVPSGDGRDKAISQGYSTNLGLSARNLFRCFLSPVSGLGSLMGLFAEAWE